MMSNEINSKPINAYWVIKDRFMAGEYPGSVHIVDTHNKVRWLMDLGINLFVDLTEPGEHGLIPYHQTLELESEKDDIAVDYRRNALRDFSKPSPEQMVEILDLIDSALLEGKNVYLHCYGGKGRTGTVVGCYLVRHGLSGEKALDRIRMLRNRINTDSERSPETDEQRNMVLEWIIGQ